MHEKAWEQIKFGFNNVRYHNIDYLFAYNRLYGWQEQEHLARLPVRSPNTLILIHIVLLYILHLLLDIVTVYIYMMFH